MGRGPSGPGHQSHSPRSYPPEFKRDLGVDRCGLPSDRRDWDREHRTRHMLDYPAHSQQSFTPRAHSPASSYRGHNPRPAREYSPPLPSPRNAHRGIQRAFPLPWTEAKSGPPSITRSPGPPEPHAPGLTLGFRPKLGPHITTVSSNAIVNASRLSPRRISNSLSLVSLPYSLILMLYNHNCFFF